MKIAQVAPLWESVPPQCYGGTERIVSYLTDELVRLGHDVTLFATADSVTAAKLDPVYPKALRLAKDLSCREAPIFCSSNKRSALKPSNSISSIPTSISWGFHSRAAAALRS